MGFRLDGFVGVNQMADGNQAAALTRYGRDGSLIVSETHGKYYEAASRGNMYHADVGTAGIALIVAAVTGNHPTLWNPLGSGVNAEIVRLQFTWISGNNAPTATYWMSTSPAGAAIATGAPIATFTSVATANCLTGFGKVGAVRWAPAVNTFTAVPAFLMGTGISLFTGVGATAVAPFTLVVDYDGMLVVPPGTALSLTSQAATTTALFAISVFCVEQAV